MKDTQNMSSIELIEYHTKEARMKRGDSLAAIEEGDYHWAEIQRKSAKRHQGIADKLKNKKDEIST